MVLDAYAVVAYLRGEPSAAAVSALLRREDCFLTAIGLAEVVDRMIRLAVAGERELVLDLAELRLLQPEPMTAKIALAAGSLRARHYDRRRRAVSMADCAAAAVARDRAATLATADPHLLAMCQAEQIAVHPLPDSRGSTWGAPG